MAVDNRTHSLGADALAPVNVHGGDAPWLHQAGGMTAEAIGCPEAAVHRPFTGRSTPSPLAFAAIIIGDSGARPQTAVPRPGIQDIGDRRPAST